MSPTATSAKLDAAHARGGGALSDQSSQLPTDDLPAPLTQDLPRVEEALDVALQSVGLPKNLLEASRYAVLAGGKRIRPVLALQCCLAVGGKVSDALLAAGAVEMIHAFSLVHDDLPALDNDALRRGMPTLHVAHGEAMAILAGDGLMSIAFQTLAGGGYPPSLAGVLCRELAEGTTRMIAGQVLDTLGGFSDKQSERERLDLIHENKTGALIRAACRMGAWCGLAGSKGAVELDSKRTNALRRVTVYGEAVGLMFQIVDDLLDVEQSAQHTGKRTGKDEEAGKRTFPGLLGIEASREEVRRLLRLSHETLSEFGAEAEGLRQLSDYLGRRTR